MNRILLRQLTRPTFRAASTFSHLSNPLRFPRTFHQAGSPFVLSIQRRTVASTVSNRPGSQTLDHAATNIKEEVGNSATDLAKVIAGVNAAKGSEAVQHGTESFFDITSFVAHAVPRPILAMGLAGTVPYVAAGATTVYTARIATLAAQGMMTNIDPGVAMTVLHQAMDVQVTYGAVILSFLGAIHWGLESAGYGGYQGYPRLLLGVAPLMVAWPTLAMEPFTALLTQWFAFLGMWFADAKTSQWGWSPNWYSQYRFYLTLLVGSCIIGSLAGTSWFGPVAGHGRLTYDLDRLREERRRLAPKTTEGINREELDIEIVPSDEYFMKILRKGHERDAEGN